MGIDSELHSQLRQRLSCNFKEIDEFFPVFAEEALALLSEQGLKDYCDGASLICMIGRGFEPVLSYLEEMPQVASQLGESSLTMVSQAVWKISRTPNGAAIPPLLQTLGEAARRLGSIELLQHYFEMVFSMMERSTGSIHGFHATIPSPGLPHLLLQVPRLLNTLSLEGVSHWIEYGLSNYSNHPERQIDYFSLQSADSRAILQRERHGTLFIDHERQLDIYLRSIWSDHEQLVPYSGAFDELRKPTPYYDAYGIRLPDSYDDRDGIAGIDRYRVLLAHIVAHRIWTTPIIADNYSPFQRIAIELFEDARVEQLAMRRYPGLQHYLLALHPAPEEGECDPEIESCLRHRLAMISYAILNPEHGYRDTDTVEFVERFWQLMEGSEGSTREIADLALSYVARTRVQSDQLPNIYFNNTEIDYRDDNRHMWRYIEEGDEEEAFEEKRKTSAEEEETDRLPPRHYHEWDYKTKSYRPDWVSLYETLHPSDSPQLIDALLAKHMMLAKRLKQIMDLLKPQHHVRVRYQEEGSELDLDVAIRSLIDLKSGATPDPRINMSHKHDGRDIAVLLLLDLSASLADRPEGSEQSILELSQEAVALLAWAIDELGDELSIAGFSSNTRHEVHYQHIKGFSERWNDEVKSRLAALQAGYSTRMGAALRHAAHYLGNRDADKKLLLVLTDGEPSDIDVDDPQMLIRDTHKAVQELDQEGIYTYCISLDSRADEYVRDIFGNHYTVIDRVERLPEKLPKLFIALTR